jgi:hypothetical protein
MSRAWLCGLLIVVITPAGAEDWPKFQLYEFPATERRCSAVVPDVKTEVLVQGKRLAGDGLAEDAQTALNYCRKLQRQAKQRCQDEVNDLIAQIDWRPEVVGGALEMVSSMDNDSITNAQDVLEEQLVKCEKEYKGSADFCNAISSQVIQSYNAYTAKLKEAEGCASPHERVTKTYDGLKAADSARAEADGFYMAALFRVKVVAWELERVRARGQMPNAPKLMNPR